jgi:predicted aspartyl protease
MNKAFVILLIIGMLLWHPSTICAEFYKYVDKEGKTHFVDDMGKIPLEYRDQLKVYNEEYDHISEKDRSKYIEMKQKNENQKTDVDIVENNVLVPVRIGYKDKEINVVLVLDTGASIMTLHRKVAEELEIESTEKALARLASGEKVEFDLAKLKFVQVGPCEKKNVLVGIMDQKGPNVKFDGLLGMNFLQYFKYTIDFDKEQIQWNPDQF